MGDPVIDTLASVWASMIALGHELSEDDWGRPTDLPGWSVQDNLAHIIGIERMMRGEPAPDVTPAPSDHVRNPLGEVNELWVESRRGCTGAEVLAEFEAVTAERLGEYRAMTDAELDEVVPTPAGMAPFREYLAIRVMDSWAHDQDIRRAVGRPGDLAGPAADVALGRITATMPLIVGKRAAAPDGSSVVFSITGAGRPEVPIVVDGRAALVDVAPDAPTVTLTMDVETYAALAFGRWSPEAALGDGRVTITGDEELGRAVVTAMAFMI